MRAFGCGHKLVKMPPAAVAAEGPLATGVSRWIYFTGKHRVP